MRLLLYLKTAIPVQQLPLQPAMRAVDEVLKRQTWCPSCSPASLIRCRMLRCRRVRQIRSSCWRQSCQGGSSAVFRGPDSRASPWTCCCSLCGRRWSSGGRPRCCLGRKEVKRISGIGLRRIGIVWRIIRSSVGAIPSPFLARPLCCRFLRSEISQSVKITFYILNLFLEALTALL